jgi:hypothetical protein
MAMLMVVVARPQHLRHRQVELAVAHKEVTIWGVWVYQATSFHPVGSFPAIRHHANILINTAIRGFPGKILP